MGVQIAVQYDLAAAFEGGVQTVRATRTRLADAGLNNGLFVCQGIADNTCKVPTSSGDVAKPIGIAPYKATSPIGFPAIGPSAQTTEYAQGDPVGAVSAGTVWVRVEGTVAAQDPVFVRFMANGPLATMGAFGNNASNPGGGATAAQVPQAVYLTSAASGALALVEINLP